MTAAPLRQVILTGDGELRLVERDRPAAASGHVVVQVVAAAICGTDVSEYRRRVANPGMYPSLPLGHEVAGTVADSASADWKVGDRVVIDPAIFCGRCATCRAGRTSHCPDLQVLGHNYGAGGLADRVTVPGRALVAVPDSVDLRTAALVEPLSCAYHAVRKVPTDRHGSVVVVGAGAIGLSIALVLRAIDVGQVTLVEPSPVRRRCAAERGFSVTPELGACHDADVVYEASGSGAGFAGAVSAVAKGGTVVVVAQHTGDMRVAADMAFGKELSIVWSLGALRTDFDWVIALLAGGQLDPIWMVRVVCLADLTTNLLADLAAARGLKPLVQVA